MMGTGDAIWFSDGDGNPAVPPHNQLAAANTANAGIVDEIEDPDAAPGTNNWYTEDGYGRGPSVSPSYGGGSYSNCSDSDAHGVTAVLTYLSSLPHRVDPRCAPGHYYILNNYNPGYFGDGKNAYTDENPANTVFTVPPSNVRTSGIILETNISLKYYGDHWTPICTKTIILPTRMGQDRSVLQHLQLFSVLDLFHDQRYLRYRTLEGHSRSI